MDLSIVIPCFNESQNLRLGALSQVAYFLDKKKYRWEVIIVDDGSNDESIHLIEEFIKTNPNFRLIKNHHQGKAATVMTGMLKGKGSIIVFSDLDQATPIKELDSLLPWFAKGYDVVIGSREGTRQGAPLLRRVMAKGFMVLRTVILGLPNIKDTQCGFKGFKKEAAKEIFSKMQLYTGKKKNSQSKSSNVTAGFDVEVLYLSKRLGYEIKEIPVEWHYVETRRVNPIKDSWQGVIDLLRVRLNSAQGLYD